MRGGKRKKYLKSPSIFFSESKMRKNEKNNGVTVKQLLKKHIKMEMIGRGLKFFLCGL